MAAKKEPSINFTVKEIVEQIHAETKNLSSKVDSVIVQTTKTNGRVNRAEDRIVELTKKSVGIWISNNPFKFTIYVALVLILLISDFRQPIVEKIVGLILWGNKKC